MRTVVRVVGSLLIIGGLALLGYAGYAYMQVQRIAMLPANLPGATPAQVLPSFEIGQSNTGSIPTVVFPPTSTPTDTPPPSATVPPVTPQPSAVPTTRVPTPTRAPTATAIPRPAPAVRLFIRGEKDIKDLPVRDAGWVTVQQNGVWVSDWDIPFDAVGHHMNTPNPGEAGNAVISGHHNLIGPNTFGVGLFAYNWNIGPGDKLYTEDATGKALEFVVQQSYPLLEAGQPLSVREEHARQAMGPTPDPALTLVTCWAGPENPFASNTYRWIVRARLVGSVEVVSIPPLAR